MEGFIVILLTVFIGIIAWEIYATIDHKRKDEINREKIELQKKRIRDAELLQIEENKKRELINQEKKRIKLEQEENDKIRLRNIENNFVTTELYIKESVKQLWEKYPKTTYEVILHYVDLYSFRKSKKYNIFSVESFYKYFLILCNKKCNYITFTDLNKIKSQWSYEEYQDVTKLVLGSDTTWNTTSYRRNVQRILEFETEKISRWYLEKIITNGLSKEIKFDSVNEKKYDYARNVSNDDIHIYTETILLTQGFLQSVIAESYIEYVRKDKNFEHLIRQHVAKHSSDSNLKEIYDMYVEFYGHVFPEKLDYYDFCLVVHMYEQSLKAVTINQLKEICESDGIHYQNLISAFRSSKETNIFTFLSKSLPTYWSDIAAKDANPQYIFSLLIPVLLYETLDIVSFQNWFIAFFSIDSFKEKYLLYYKHNNLLQDNSSLKENLLSKYMQVKTGEEFEMFLREVYLQLGYSVQMTPTTGDQGADLIIEKHGVKSAVQAKHYSSPVGNKAVQEIVAALNYYKVSKGIVVTNNEFTKSAIELAKANNIELIDGKALTKMIGSIKL